MAKTAAIAQAYLQALSDRNVATPSTLGYVLSGTNVYNVLANYDLERTLILERLDSKHP